MAGSITTEGQRRASTEAELIECVCQGECALFHDLIAPYRRLMFGVAHSILSRPEDAEEAVQEGVLKTFLNLKQLQDRSQFKSWMLRIVGNEARLHRRKARSQLYESLDEGDDREQGTAPRQWADWHDLPDEELTRNEVREAVRKAVNSLPPSYREVYLLADAEDLSMAQIAELLGVSVGLVKTRLHRARMRVQEQLTPVFKPRFSDSIRLMKGMNPWSRAGK